MSCFKFDLFFYAALLFFSIFVSSHQSTVFLFEHFRHGARSTSKLSANFTDIFNQTWKGDSELTNVGLRQHFILGMHIKNLYTKFINSLDVSKDVLVLSSKSNRTIMSAIAQLQGIYYNSGSPTIDNITQEQLVHAVPPFINKNEALLAEHEKLGLNVFPGSIDITPPVHIIHTKDKIFQFEKNDGCDGIKQARKLNENKKEVQDFITKYNQKYSTQLFKLLNISKEDHFKKLDNIGKISITLIANVVDGRNLTSLFANSGINEQELLASSYEYYNIYAKHVLSNDRNNELALASSSVLMRQVLSYMQDVIDQRKKNITVDDNKATPKMVLLSGHDSTLVGMQDFLRVAFGMNVSFPEFASYLFIELTNDDQTYNVRITFNNNEKEKIEIPYDEFKTKIEQTAWTFEETGYYCKFLYKQLNIFKPSTIIFAIATGVIIVIMLFLKLKHSFTKRPLTGIDAIKNEPLVQ